MYFYVLFLWASAISDFRPLEIYENVRFLLSTSAFIVNDHAENHFCKYIYLFQILYSMKSVFFIKMHVKVFGIQIWFKIEAPLLFLLIRTVVYRKKILY